MLRELSAVLKSLPRPTWQRQPPDVGLGAGRGDRRVVRFYLIKPSRYDDNGRLMQFRWGVIPGHTLTVLNGLARAWAAGRSDVELQVVIWDELVDPALDPATIAAITTTAQLDGAELLIGLVGVQTGEYPRARDLALRFRARGGAVAIGGFHVSSDAGSRSFLESVGVTTVRGEAETTIALLLDDFLAGSLQPSYQPAAGLRARTGTGAVTVPAITATPLPEIDVGYLQRFFNPRFSTIDASRGCPFVCSFCAVQNVMGRSVRARDPRRVIDWIAHAYDDHEVHTFLIVDDDLFRSPTWEPLLAGIAELRRERRSLALFLQTDVEAGCEIEGNRSGRAARAQRFVELVAAAGCYQVFMGFESLEPANLAAIGKLQNQASAGQQPAAERLWQRYRRVVATWHAAGVGVHCGYMLGLPGDGPGCGGRAARQLADLGVDVVSFFAATPLPGTEDYQAAVRDGSLEVHDWNAYDTTHFVRRHPRLSRAELEQEYRSAYRAFYSARRLAWSAATLHRVAGLSWSARAGMLAQQVYYGYAARRGWHPMLGGIGRRKTADHRRAVGDRQARNLYFPDESVGDAPANDGLQPRPESLIEVLKLSA